MSDFEQLNPCPFCGSGETLIVPGPSTWSGMKSSEPSTYSVRHWCDPIKGQPARMLERIGRDKQSAIEAWNTRAAIASMQGEAVEISKDSKLPFQIRIGNGTVGKGCKFSTLLLRINAHNEWFAQQGFHLIPDKDAKISEQDARIKELEQQLEVVRKDEEWKPIQTAPKDGTVLMVFSRTHGYVSAWWGQVDGGGHPENGPPVYWWVSDHCEFIDGPYDAPLMWKPLNELSDTVIAAILQIGGAE